MEEISYARRVSAVLVPALAVALTMLVGCLSASQAFAAETAAPGAPGAPDTALQQGVESDPLVRFNEAMFTFNLKLDDWVLHPVASGYARITPEEMRVAVGRFFDNIAVIPRFANNLFQLRFPQASSEVARFGINSTVGLFGFFDPADKWFGLREHPDDFGLTLRYYDVPTGPYLMLPFLGPSTIGDAVGRGVDGSMNPMSYLLPWWVSLAAQGGATLVDAVNYRSLHLNQFEEADRYAIDLYGAVQDAYLQTRRVRVSELKGAKGN